jgi:hypothetical protein
MKKLLLALGTVLIAVGPNTEAAQKIYCSNFRSVPNLTYEITSVESKSILLQMTRGMAEGSDPITVDMENITSPADQKEDRVVFSATQSANNEKLWEAKLLKCKTLKYSLPKKALSGPSQFGAALTCDGSSYLLVCFLQPF